LDRTDKLIFRVVKESRRASTILRESHEMTHPNARSLL
jgi:hypothetical protein